MPQYPALPMTGVPVPTPAPRALLSAPQQAPRLLGPVQQQQRPGLLSMFANPDMMPAWAMMLGGANPQQQMAGFSQGMMQAVQTKRERDETAKKKAEEEAKRAKALEFLRTNAPQYAGAVDSGVIDPAQAYSLAIAKPKEQTPTDDMREYQVAQQQGFGGSFMDYMGAVKSAGAPRYQIMP